MKEFKFDKIKDLKYGENPHQAAWLYSCEEMADYEVLFGKELSYDNILNLYEIAGILSEFFDVNAVAILKHASCCGVALGRTIEEAYNKAFDCDPVSAFYGTIGFSKPVDYETAKHLNSMGVKVVMAPDFHPKALNLMKENTGMKVVKLNTPLKNIRNMCAEEIKITPFGVLIQEKNTSELDKDLFKVVTKTKPTTEQIEDAIFAWKVIKHTSTNSALVAKDFATLGIAKNETNSATAIETALKIACDGSKNAVIATDGIIYSQDAIYAAVQGRVGLIIQPGGSHKDKDIIDLADRYGVAMIMTGIRNHKY